MSLSSLACVCGPRAPASLPPDEQIHEREPAEDPRNQRDAAESREGPAVGRALPAFGTEGAGLTSWVVRAERLHHSSMPFAAARACTKSGSSCGWTGRG